MGIVLNNTISLKNGLSISNSYAKIGFFEGNNKDKVFNFALEYYVDYTARESGKLPVKTEMYSFEFSSEEDSNNFIKQAYLYLKTLDKFKNSRDIFE